MFEIIIIFGGLFFVFVMTVLGAGSVFFMNKLQNAEFGRFILGNSVGIMLATAVFALLVPAVGEAEGISEILMVTTGFMLGCIILLLMDRYTSKKEKSSAPVGILFAMTLHNIPEGMTVGLAFSLYAKNPEKSGLLYAAVILAVGIGIQNFPESMALAMTFTKNGLSKRKAFVMSIISGAVEPVFGILSIFLYEVIASVLPFFLAYAAGTMLHITVEELIPDIQTPKRGHLGTIGIMSGILIMLALEMIQKI